MESFDNKKYLILCSCGFKLWTDLKQEEIGHLVPFTGSCASCGGKNQYKCPNCGYIMKAKLFVQPPLPQEHRFGDLKDPKNIYDD